MISSQTIALSMRMLADGRSADVARMLGPLVGRNEAVEENDILGVALMARVTLLREGDPEAAYRLLRPYTELASREKLPSRIRAEVALWLGWIHAWPDVHVYDEARALNLFDEALRFFKEDLSAYGRCWANLGQALAYAGIDEYQLVLQSLKEAEQVREQLHDLAADEWIHELYVTGLRFQGHYGSIPAHLEALAKLGREDGISGKAHAYRAMLLNDLGKPPAEVLEEAESAITLLRSSLLSAGYPLLVAYRAQLRALRRSGDWQSARVVLREAMGALRDMPSASAYLSLERARLAMVSEQYDEARLAADETMERMHHHRHQILASGVALLRGELAVRDQDQERAEEWMERSYRSARETGYVRHQLRALLALADLAIGGGRLEEARRYLREAEEHVPYFGLLPFAAFRFRVLAHLARAEGRADAAREAYIQALTACSLLQDAYRTARIRFELAEIEEEDLGSRSKPQPGKSFTDAIGNGGKRVAGSVVGTSIGSDALTDSEAALLASLAGAAVSVALVVEAWLRLVAYYRPTGSRAVFRLRESGQWERVQSYGEMSVRNYPDGTSEVCSLDGLTWIRMRTAPGCSFYTALGPTSLGDESMPLVLDRITRWLPICTLALNHALLRNEVVEARPSASEAREQRLDLPGFVYGSPALADVAAQIHRIRSSHSTVLITGESGTGKEIVARAIHSTSERKSVPFVAFNCSTVPRELFDSHLFGHEKGAFTGADRSNQGIIRAADGGTLFLDEIGDLPLEMQPKLLRFLQEGEVFPLGARKPVQVNVRVIAATNQDLEALIKSGRFREDLYYRLNVIPIRVPALRHRREEIPLLVRHFLEQLTPAGTPSPVVTPRAMDRLMAYDWPGNVRQLRNEIERALVFVSNEPAPTIDINDLSPALVASAVKSPTVLVPAELGDKDLDTVMAETERRFIERALQTHRGQVAAAANALGLTRQGLYKKIKRLQIDIGTYQTRAGEERLLHLN